MIPDLRIDLTVRKRAELLSERMSVAQLGKDDRMQTPPKASEEMTASLRPHALGPSLGTVPLVALSQHRLLVQHRTQQ